MHGAIMFRVSHRALNDRVSLQDTHQVLTAIAHLACSSQPCVLSGFCTSFLNATPLLTVSLPQGWCVGTGWRIGTVVALGFKQSICADTDVWLCVVVVCVQGPRVKMGMYSGTPTRVMPHTTTGRADYFGPMVRPVAIGFRFRSAMNMV
jgi:hypothetical protein